VDPLPRRGAAERRAWLGRSWLIEMMAAVADGHHDLLVQLYGRERGVRARHAEAFEVCEYGARLTPELLAKLFPFFTCGRWRRADH
jgi:hypothetical protein